MSRPRDFAWEALVEVTSSDPDTARGELNAALKSIREQAGVDDSYLLADEIHARAKLYRQVFENAALTPSALAKHWLRVLEESERARKAPTRTNLHASSDCPTCNGDLFVFVLSRPPRTSAWMNEHNLKPNGELAIEEYAPCPDCGPEMSRVPDPARVRELMRG